MHKELKNFIDNNSDDLKRHILTIDAELLAEIMLISATALNSVDTINRVASEIDGREPGIPPNKGSISRVEMFTKMIGKIAYNQNKIASKEDFIKELSEHVDLKKRIGML